MKDDFCFYLRIYYVLLIIFFVNTSVKLVGKLQDGTVFFEKGRDEEDKLFEFKTDEGK